MSMPSAIIVVVTATDTSILVEINHQIDQSACNHLRDTIKVTTWGTNTIEGLQLVIDGATQQINFVQHINSMPPAAAVQLLQSRPTASHRYPSDIAGDFPKLMVNDMGKFPDFQHGIMLTDNAIPIARPVRQMQITRCAAVEKEVEQMVIDDIWE
uniref:Uncharacterized protein n=1 Tax=Romanomermis culicivorax TaxID=13658 RepID=A0A915JX91_ROMCU